MTRLQGSAIILTILAVAAMVTLGLGMAQLVPKDFRSSLALESSINAENAAWAGIEHALLLLRNNKFYELSQSYVPPVDGNITQLNPASRPHSIYPPEGSVANCYTNRKLGLCKGLDRQLGTVKNANPYYISTMLGRGTRYGLVIWHRKQNVGNTTSAGLDDDLPLTINDQPNAANINPLLERDELRRLDIRGVTRLNITWKPYYNRLTCQQDNGATSSQFVVSLFDANGQLLPGSDARKILLDGKENEKIIDTTGAVEMALRFLTNNADSEKVAGCFARYALDTSISTGDKTADLGFDVIDSVGESGGVRRKIRVLVNRENGKLLNIFDFGLACEECQI